MIDPYAGDKYPCCALLSVLPAKDISLETAETEVMQVMDSLASEGITQKELQRIKKALPLSSCSDM